MEASEVWHKAQQAWHSVKTPNDGPVQLDHSYPDAAATAIIEQAIRDAITEDRRGRTFTVSELDKARAEGMERAAVIADDARYGIYAAAAIRASMEANHAK